MLIVSKNGEIELTRGDTARLTVDITTATGQPYSVQKNDVLTLSLKRKVKDFKPCLQKEVTGSNVFHIEPKDTAGLDFGKYVYDVELLTIEGDVYTVIEKQNFNIGEEVTTR